jgi:hypothetical protein
MDISIEKYINIDDIIDIMLKGVDSEDYQHLKNRFYRFQPSLFYNIRGIQNRKSKILKKNTIGLFKISSLLRRPIIIIFTPDIYIYFNYNRDNTLYSIDYSTAGNEFNLLY